MDELLNRQMPQSLEAEQAVLGSILIDSRCVADVIGIVKPEDFYMQQKFLEEESSQNILKFEESNDLVSTMNEDLKKNEAKIAELKNSALANAQKYLETSPQAEDREEIEELIEDLNKVEKKEQTKVLEG